jgi:hypothetical protein
MKNSLFLFLLMLPALTGWSQVTPTGFDPKEYLGLLDVGNRSYSKKDTATYADLIYRSPELGLKNQFDIWLRPDNTAIICIRGTVQDISSWLENFYSAMTPATGSIQINDSTNFKYQLAEDPRASVHVGWMIGLAHMAPSIVEQIISLNRERKISNYILFGHSQGGALCFLTTSYLLYLQKNGGMPKELTFKSYCSAAPKPGNLYYAYDYDFITRNGKSYTIVNTADWVPETSFSIQTIEDFNRVNPFNNIKPALKKQKMLARWYLNSVYNKLDNSSRKANKMFNKYLGKKLYPQVKKFLPQLREPVYAGSLNYMRAGTPIVLLTDSSYHAKFDKSPDQVFQHHFFEPYAWLVRTIYLEGNKQ